MIIKLIIIYHNYFSRNDSRNRLSIFFSCSISFLKFLHKSIYSNLGFKHKENMVTLLVVLYKYLVLASIHDSNNASSPLIKFNSHGLLFWCILVHPVDRILVIEIQLNKFLNSAYVSLQSVAR